MLFRSLGDEDDDSNIYGNGICPPYPECIEEYLGEQDTSECTPCQLSEIGYQEVNDECFFQSDLDILNFLIGNNPNLNPDLDIDSSGVIETLEFGIQEWMNNRLTSLDLSNVGLSGEIPDTIMYLTTLETLKLHSNNITSVSDSICNLTNLSWSLGDEDGDSNIYGNSICPPYPECIEDSVRSEEHTSELQSRRNLVCRLLLE